MAVPTNVGPGSEELIRCAISGESQQVSSHPHKNNTSTPLADDAMRPEDRGKESPFTGTPQTIKDARDTL